MPELSSAEEYVFWFGSGCPIALKYDTSKFDYAEKSRLSEEGLKSLKTNYRDAFSREILTRNYEKKLLNPGVENTYFKHLSSNFSTK